MAYPDQAGAQARSGSRTKRQRTRAAILDAALAEASERGLHRASVTGIAARANTAVGSLHYHFGSRAELLRAMLRKLMADFSARLAALQHQRPGQAEDFFERLRTELLAYVDYVRSNPAHIRLVDEIRFFEPELYRQGIATWVELLSARLRDGITNGSVRPMGDAEIAAQAHFLVGAHRFLEELVEMEREEEIVDAYLGLVRRGLGRTDGDDHG
jgi:AcrR family transcriptional regulator